MATGEGRLVTHTNYLFHKRSGSLGGWNKSYGSCAESIKYGGTGISHIYIPVEWIEIFGESEEDLKQWVEFINRQEVNTKTTYLGKGKIGEYSHGHTFADNYMFTPFKRTNGQGTYTMDNEYWTSNTYTVVSRNEFYCVELARLSGSLSMDVYFTFIMIRWFYNHHYRPIRADIHKILAENEVNEWQALLLAQGMRGYCTSYNLCTNSYTPNIFLSKEFYWKRMYNEQYINYAFSAFQNPYSANEYYAHRFLTKETVESRIAQLKEKYEGYSKRILEYV